MKLKKGDMVLTAYAQSACGPGWANRPLWVIIQGRDMELRLECLQPKEQTQDMNLLYPISERVHAAMTAEVRRKLKGGADGHD